MWCSDWLLFARENSKRSNDQSETLLGFLSVEFRHQYAIFRDSGISGKGREELSVRKKTSVCSGPNVQENIKIKNEVRYMALIFVSHFILVTAMGGYQERCTTESMLCSLFMREMIPSE